ncbi:MAG: efflux RND transporter permease subunit, partial [Pseudomonadota bacterium]
MVGFFVRHPVASNLMMALFCVLGLATVANIERETFPEFSSDSVSISVIYPGASAADVNEEICAPLEDALTGLAGLADFECLSVEGRATGTAELEENGDITVFFNDVFSAVSGIGDFPTDAETPAVEIAARTDLVALVAISGIVGRDGLVAYADELADRLIALPGVAEATVSGITDREIRIRFDQEALRRYGLSGRDLVDAIEARSLSQPLGNADLDEASLVLRYVGAGRSVADLEALIVIENAEGGLVRLADLATVVLVDSDENRQSYIDGSQAAILSIAKAKDDDSIRVFGEVEALIEAERARFPAPFEITVINNITELVEERLSLIVQNTILGLVLVFVTMWLFFSLGQALWISAALPVSFLGALFAMSALGITINMITLVALLMSVGLIMDDSIVIAENIDKWRQKVGPVEAATRGTLEVLPGVLSSFLTTACVFGPLMFLSGEMGQILRFIPMVLLITLSISLIEGFLILPNHLSHAGRTELDRRPAARVLERVRDRFVLPLAGWLVAWRHLTVGTALAALILSIGLVTSGQIKVIGFPSTEGDTITARIALTSGIARERTEATVEQILSGLDAVNADLTPATEGGQPLVARVLVQYAVNADVQDNGSHSATITVDLLESAARNVSADDVLDAWRRASGPLPDVVQVSFSQAQVGPGGLDIDVEILGRDIATLEVAASRLVAELLARDDVTEAYQDLYGGRDEVQIRLNEYGYSVGLTPQALSAQLRNAFQGSETDSFRQGASELTVRVELADTVASLTELELFPVVLNGGVQTSLVSVADLTTTASYPTITAKNGQIVARIQGKIDRAATTST